MNSQHIAPDHTPAPAGNQEKNSGLATETGASGSGSSSLRHHSGAQKENMLANFLFNIIIPSLILSKSEKYAHIIDPALVWPIALLFPISYGAYDYWKRRQHNLFSIIGFASILFSGVLGILKIGGIWIAVKEAVFPSTFGILVLATSRGKKPLIKTMLLNENLLNTARIEAALETHGTARQFDAMLLTSTYALAATFFFSALLNFGLAVWLIQSPAGTPAFNQEMAKMTMLSWPVIALPNMLLLMGLFWYLLKNIRLLTQLGTDEIFHQPPTKPNP